MNLELTSKQQGELEKLQSDSECQKLITLGCSDFRNLPKVRKIGGDSLLECLDENPVRCSQALLYGSTYFCRCPVRAYIYRKLGI